MIVSLGNPVFQTYIFSIILFVVLLLSLRKRKDDVFFGVTVSQELKGFAILTIVFAHITYALVSDTRFLAPLASMAGVGVNLFLILSGYGLVASALKKPLSITQFYKRRLFNLFIPFWVCLLLFFVLDYFLLNLNYGIVYIFKSFLGIFNRADLYQDVNSPFWYFSWIVMYYLLFPLVYIKRAPWLSAILIYLIPLTLIKIQPPFLDYVIHLYQIHVIAFPLGMFLAWFLNSSNLWLKIKSLSQNVKNKNFYYYFSFFCLLGGIFYFYKNSGVGESPLVEEVSSVVASLLLISWFIIKRFEIRLLYLIGIFSYEIYIFHWPLMYRYDFLFKYLPAWLALILYFPLFIALAYFLRWFIEKITVFLSKKETK